MASGESATGLSTEFGISRQSVYNYREAKEVASA
ncbi:putative transcriptional regulator [Tsukamurella ocularis]|nr:putative transcriptional regulator [Tsukamurella ocularis]MCS3787234.1 putative transcriptional regulator [Tsukamurella ocularis]MCS3852625.1 putative transcriptional regulator [Tsukamurella ocularis]